MGRRTPRMCGLSLAPPRPWYVSLDVVHVRAGGAGFALQDLGDGRLAQHGSGRRGGLGEDALGAATERAVEQLDDLEHGDLPGRAGERVAALDTALGLQDSRPAQDREQLLEELDRNVAPPRQLADRDRRRVAHL